MPSPKTPGSDSKTSNGGKFQKGKSGNPSGRPKGARSMKTLISRELKSPITISEDGKKKRVRRSEALAKGLMNDALRGRDRPRDTVLRYADAIDQDSRKQAAAEILAQEQASLDRYVRRRIRELNVSTGEASDDEERKV